MPTTVSALVVSGVRAWWISRHFNSQSVSWPLQPQVVLYWDGSQWCDPSCGDIKVLVPVSVRASRRRKCTVDKTKSVWSIKVYSRWNYSRVQCPSQYTKSVRVFNVKLIKLTEYIEWTTTTHSSRPTEPSSTTSSNSVSVIIIIVGSVHHQQQQFISWW